jgi:nicotinamidase-related amidase
MAIGDGVATPGGGEIYILITQCLQNDFFLNLNCRLSLPKDAASKLLIHPMSEDTFDESKSRRKINPGTLEKGPLGRLLEATVGKRLRGDGLGTLHLVNIRDWHTPGEHYDRERRVYGSHCQAGSWGAEYVDGLTSLLDPDGTRRPLGDARTEDPGFDPMGRQHGSVVVHHVHSGTLFDLESFAFDQPSELARVLGEIITPENHEHVRVAVIGVYTDIKIQIVLQSLRVAYNLENLVVSDSLTASPTLERHLGALDFANKVLGVEVMHGVGDLARFLGSDPEDEELESSASEIAFADYAQYFRDKQSIVSYEDTQLRNYRAQIMPRLDSTVKVINLANRFLIACGIATLGATVALALIAGFRQTRVPVVFPSLLLGLSVVQTVWLFFNRPVKGLATTLSREAVFRMLLESRSLRLALARQHLTAPQALSAEMSSSYGIDFEGADRGDARFREAMRRGKLRTALLRDQLKVLTDLDKVDFDWLDTFADIGDNPEHDDDAAD